MSVDSQQLLLLRITNLHDSNGQTYALTGYVSEVEAVTGGKLGLRFRGPYKITSNEESDSLWVMARSPSVPIFDHTSESVQWACFENDVGIERRLQYLTIGPQFSLISRRGHFLPIYPPGMDRFPTYSNRGRRDAYEGPGLIMHGDLISLSCEKWVDGQNHAPLIAQNIEDVSQKGDGFDSPWTLVPFETNSKHTFGDRSMLFQSFDPGVKYVYQLRMRSQPPDMERVFIDQMRDNQFKSLTKTKHSLWQTYAIMLNEKLCENRPVPVFTTNHNTSKRRLFLLRLPKTGGRKSWTREGALRQIDVFSVDLRPDGSINSTNFNFSAVRHNPIDFTPAAISPEYWYFDESRNLKAVDLNDGRVLLMWEELMSTKPKDEIPNAKFLELERLLDGRLARFIPHAMVAKVDESGLLTEWQEVSMEFENPPDEVENENEQSVWSAVMGPPGFVS